MFDGDGMILLNRRYKNKNHPWIYVPLRFATLDLIPASGDEMADLIPTEVVYYRTENEQRFNHSEEAGCTVERFEQTFELIKE